MPAQNPIVYWSYPFSAMVCSPVSTQVLAAICFCVQVYSSPVSSLMATPTKVYLRYDRASAKVQEG